MPPFTDHELLSLRRLVATAGPGHRGHRSTASPEERQKIAFRLREAGEDVPPFLQTNTEWIDRAAKLFEAGDYPDKGVSVAVEDLQAIAESFDLPVPLLIEHADSPLELGYLTEVKCLGSELFGTISLTPEADALVRSSGGRSLSLGLSPDLRSIREVSLVRHPRVPTAQLFSQTGNVVFDADIEAFTEREIRAERERLRQEQLSLEADQMVRRYMAQGRLCPAQAEIARTILASEATISFHDEISAVRDLVIALIERQPPMSLFAESVPARVEPGNHLLLPEEAAFYRRHFPDIGLEEIAKVRSRFVS